VNFQVAVTGMYYGSHGTGRGYLGIWGTQFGNHWLGGLRRT